MSTDNTDPYLNWPYSAGYLLKTLDPKLIENHASAILSRALNIGRVVAFVGAGTSMAYGRISWKSLVQSERNLVIHEYNTQYLVPGSNLNPDIHIERLYNTIMKINLDRDDVPPDRYPMMFQACEQLGEAILRYKQQYIGTKAGVRLSELKQHAMNLTIDDRGHARQIIMDAIREDVNS